MLVRTGKGERTAVSHPELAGLAWFDDLAQAVDRLLRDQAS